MNHFDLLDLQTKTQMIGLFCTSCSYNKQSNTKNYFRCAPSAKTTGRRMDFITTTQQHKCARILTSWHICVGCARIEHIRAQSLQDCLSRTPSSTRIVFEKSFFSQILFPRMRRENFLEPNDWENRGPSCCRFSTRDECVTTSRTRTLM